MGPEAMIAEKTYFSWRGSKADSFDAPLLDGYGRKDLESGGPTGRPGGGGESEERGKQDEDDQARIRNRDVGDALLLE